MSASLDHHRSPDIPCVAEDLWLDAASINPGKGRFEKLVSGLHLGELTRRLLTRLWREAEVSSSPTWRQ